MLYTFLIGDPTDTDHPQIIADKSEITTFYALSPYTAHVNPTEIINQFLSTTSHH